MTRDRQIGRHMSRQTADKKTERQNRQTGKQTGLTSREIHCGIQCMKLAHYRGDGGRTVTMLLKLFEHLRDINKRALRRNFRETKKGIVGLTAKNR